MFFSTADTAPGKPCALGPAAGVQSLLLTHSKDPAYE
jgi:hypothetical protein